MSAAVWPLGRVGQLAHDWQRCGTLEAAAMEEQGEKYYGNAR